MSGVDPRQFGEEGAFEFNQMTESQIELCRRLDKIFKSHGIEIMPSKMFEGAVCASDSKLRHNPDWLAQAANSLREILYPFCSPRKKGLPKKILTEGGAIKNRDFASEIGRIFNLLNGLAHHGNSDNSKLSKEDIQKVDFDQLIVDFEMIMREALKRQLDVYSDIDSLIEAGFEKAERKQVDDLINANPDAKDYFFAKVPIEWISWLKDNGFFEVLNKEAEDETRYAYRMSELGYILRVAESEGDEEKIVEIMNSVDCVNNFNPEVVDQFIWIMQKLSLKSLVSILTKFKDENWIKLMKGFKPTGHTYESIVKKLTEANEFGGLLILAEALLALDTEDKERGYFDDYFYVDDISSSGIFESLSNLEGDFAESGIELILKILIELTQEKNDEEDAAFTYESNFSLYDVDLFNMAITQRRRISDREDIKSLLSALTSLIKSKISRDCENGSRQVYDKYFKLLPDSQWTWRIQMFAMSHCPELFSEDIKQEIDRIFSVSKYSHLLWGTEYLNTLRVSFSLWSDREKRDFVEKVLDKFEKLIAGLPEEDWHKRQGWEILSVVAPELTQEESEKAKNVFEEELNAAFIPKPTVSEMRGGMVQDRSPVNLDKYKDIGDLVQELKKELAPEALKEKYKDDDFLNPRNAEGVGNELRKDMKKRMSLYLAHASNFLDPSLNIHYTYSFLRGIEEYLREKNKLNKEDWNNLFEMFAKMKEAKREDYAENTDDEDRWLARWFWVEKTIANILKYFLTKEYEELFEEKRDFVLELIRMFLESEDPKPENEANEYGDLFHIAINSTRGVAFQALVNFVYRDGESLKDDVFNLYKETIEKASPSVRFVVGHYLGSFYLRDREKIKGIFELIFPQDEDSREEFFVAWEGYLLNALYKELFEDLEEYYKYALSLDSSLYPDRPKTRDLDQGIGTHLALAFAHFDEVQYTEKDKYLLLKQLWNSNDTKKQKEFISFLGRGIISNGNASNEWFEEKNVKLQKLKDFWDLILNRDDLEQVIYEAFGCWVNHKKKIFDYGWLAGMVARTIEKSNGVIDWDHGIVYRLHEFAKADPGKTLVILEKYLLGGILGDSGKNWFYLDDKKIEVFKELYKVKPEETKDLINKLLEKGGRPFWPLKDIIEE